jgi:hypothetical protein
VRIEVHYIQEDDFMLHCLLVNNGFENSIKIFKMGQHYDSIFYKKELVIIESCR